MQFIGGLLLHEVCQREQDGQGRRRGHSQIRGRHEPRPVQGARATGNTWLTSAPRSRTGWAARRPGIPAVPCGTSSTLSTGKSPGSTPGSRTTWPTRPVTSAAGKSGSCRQFPESECSRRQSYTENLARCPATRGRSFRPCLASVRSYGSLEPACTRAGFPKGDQPTCGESSTWTRGRPLSEARP